MPISREDFDSTAGIETMNNATLLSKMKSDLAYSTKDVQEMLGGISHGAALQRLKRLKEKGYVQEKRIKRNSFFVKVKEWEPEPETPAAEE